MEFLRKTVYYRGLTNTVYGLTVGLYNRFCFQMINGVFVEELSKGDDNMPEKYTEEEAVVKISNLQRLEVWSISRCSFFRACSLCRVVANELFLFSGSVITQVKSKLHHRK